MTRERAEAVRAEGERAVGRIERNGPPFSEGWEHWTQDPDWRRPGLIEGWDDLSMYSN
jgi:hypothetical protein